MKGWTAAALLLAALAAAPSAAATNECRGLNPCVKVAGPWVVVPAQRSIPRPQAQFQLTCPRGFVVAGVDAELSDQAIDLAFLGASGTPVSPGVTTSRSLVFVGSYAGDRPRAPTFRPHVGCVPASGGGSRTPTAVRAVTPPGHPVTRRVVTERVRGEATADVACRADERLVGWYASRGFATPAPPAPALVASLFTKATVRGNAVSVLARAGRGQGIVQLGALCAGGR
ncbi:MAG TPA: hypothetical protein VFB35_02040 [Gaiellaceae bacterium]|nr:hypothetical protein [Gaiellaceae bacterium]